MDKPASEGIVDQVKERYGRIARETSGCCGPVPISCGTVEIGYDAKELASIPEEANLGLGCGAPVERLGLRAGETVLDLGSGGGIDVFLAAHLVGPTGRVFGVDMTPDMLARARANAIKGGYTNVEFREGRLESLPIDDATIDAVTSNCVINLVPDKAAVFREIYRVLKPRGRLVVSDIVLDGNLPDALQKSILAYVGCLAGALQRERYFEIVRAEGLRNIEVLADVDFLAALGNNLPDDVRMVLEESGARVEELLGIVRSVTFRAEKPV
ncbi:MAG TPA: arsenite methyltransferase [Vicinamibacteria bacterium]|nr:arsenite methyltransferase [Vicinamibacteria bacterium]